MIRNLVLYLGEGETAGTLAGENSPCPDALVQLREWQQRGLGLYLLGSEGLETRESRLQESSSGDLAPLFSNYFSLPGESTSQRSAFREIASSIGSSSLEILLLSDHEQALDTAQRAGFATRWLLPDSEPDPEARHVMIHNFGELDWLLG